MGWLICWKQPLQVISQHSTSTIISKRFIPTIWDFGCIECQGFDAELTCRARGINTSQIWNKSVSGNWQFNKDWAILTTLPSAFDPDTILNFPPEPLFGSESSKLNKLRTAEWMMQNMEFQLIFSAFYQIKQKIVSCKNGPVPLICSRCDFWIR